MGSGRLAFGMGMPILCDLDQTLHHCNGLSRCLETSLMRGAILFFLFGREVDLGWPEFGPIYACSSAT